MDLRVFQLAVKETDIALTHSGCMSWWVLEAISISLSTARKVGLFFNDASHALAIVEFQGVYAIVWFVAGETAVPLGKRPSPATPL